MRFQPILALLLGVAAASPISQAETSSVTADATLRLIKTSEEDTGTWVSEDEKIENYVAKGVNFIDITDMNVSGVVLPVEAPEPKTDTKAF